MPVNVVKVNSKRSNFTHYIGRAVFSGNGLPESCFHSPFRIGVGGAREEVIAKFAEYWYAPEQVLLRGHALQMLADDDILGCWCKPLDCHGDIIAGYVNWKRQAACLW